MITPGDLLIGAILIVISLQLNYVSRKIEGEY